MLHRYHRVTAVVSTLTPGEGCLSESEAAVRDRVGARSRGLGVSDGEHEGREKRDVMELRIEWRSHSWSRAWLECGLWRGAVRGASRFRGN